MNKREFNKMLKLTTSQNLYNNVSKVEGLQNPNIFGENKKNDKLNYWIRLLKEKARY